MVADERERCLVFASKNPEIVLPDNLDFDANDVVSTPVSEFSFEPIVTTITLRKTPTVLTKANPYGLSHPFKIA